MAILILLLTLLSFYPQDSIQMNLFSKYSVISTSCNYSYDLQNRYICDLQSPLYTSPNDVLEITGTHLDGNVDADVIAVNYYSNVTSYFNGEVLTKFENLKFLYFYGSGIQELGNNSFKVCPKLETIHGTMNNLTSFPSKLFENCENLKVFNFFAQNVQEVPDDLFGMTKNLEKFKLNTFKVTSLPEKLLQNMENLRIFDINGNKLTELSPNLLIAAVNLEEVDVSFNEFKDQWKLVYALNGHPNLKKLDMKYNRFTDFDFRFFSQFQKLETLQIDSWRSNFSQISWQSLPSSMLYLNVDRIGEEIPENAFERLVNLKELILSGSGIENLHKDTFKGLTNLEDLEVTSTNIKTLHPELFMSLTSLSDLNLGYNQIEELPIGIFAPLINLGHKSEFDGLKMPINMISRLNANSFGLHPHLRYIRFYQNTINEIEKGIFSKFHSNLTNVDLKYNTCVNGIFSGDNLDDNETFSECHKNWIEIIPTTTEEIATTPGGAGSNFKQFDIIIVILIGFFKVLINFDN